MAITFNELLVLSGVLLTLDFVWIKLIMQKLYTNMIQKIQRTSMIVRFFSVLITYAIIISSIVIFAMPRVSSENTFSDSLFYGGILGLLMYGMFSFTNYSLIKEWSIFVALMDTLWGFLLYATATYVVMRFKYAN